MDYYCVGIANDPQPEDKLRYFEYGEALKKARSRADIDPNLPIAIWDMKDALIRLFFLGTEFQEDA